jgi:non-specific protein-tyrosine kinase
MEVQLGLPTSGTIDPNLATNYAVTEAAIANQPNTVHEAVVQAARGVPAAESRHGIDNVSCSPRGTTALFSCSVTARSPLFAAAVANQLAKVFIATENAWQQSRYAQVIKYIKEQIAKARDSGNSSALRVLEPIYPQVQLTAAQESNLARLITPAAVPNSPASPHPLLNAVIAFVLILVLVLGLGRLADMFDDSIQGEYELKTLTGIPIIGFIPAIGALRGKPLSRSTLVMHDSPQSRTAEAFRAARTGIAFATAGKPPHAMLFSSALPGEGKSTVAANVAVSFAEAGKSVVLLDLDLWHHSVSTIFDIPEVGVTDLLIADNPDPAPYLVSSGIPNLRILPTGSIPPNPAQMIGSPRMEWIMRRLKGLADLIVVDSPALLTVADAAVAAALCDEVILIVRPERSKRRSVLRAVEMLQSAGVQIAGLVVNSVGKWDTGRPVDVHSFVEYRANSSSGHGQNGHRNALVGSMRDTVER